MNNSSNLETLERNARDERMLYLKLRGRTMQQIADDVGCSPRTVYRRIPILLDKQAARMTELAKREIVYQLSAMDQLLSELHIEWEKSCNQRREIVTRNEGGGEYQGRADGAAGLEAVSNGKFKSSSAETLIDGIGDPRLLEQIRALWADKRRLLRLDKDDNLQAVLHATQINIIQPGAKDNPMAVFAPMAPAELAETYQIMASLGMNPDGTVIKQLPDPNVIEATFTAEDALKIAEKSVLYDQETGTQ